MIPSRSHGPQTQTKSSPLSDEGTIRFDPLARSAAGRQNRYSRAAVGIGVCAGRLVVSNRGDRNPTLREPG